MTSTQQVNDALLALTRAIERAVAESVEVALDANDSVRGLVDDAVSKAVEQAVAYAVEEAVDAALRDGEYVTPSDVTDAVETALSTGAVDSSIESAVTEALDERIDSVVEDAVRDLDVLAKDGLFDALRDEDVAFTSDLPGAVVEAVDERGYITEDEVESLVTAAVERAFAEHHEPSLREQAEATGRKAVAWLRATLASAVPSTR